MTVPYVPQNTSQAPQGAQVVAFSQRPFNPRRRARTTTGRAVMAEALQRIDDHEIATGARKRRRRPADRQSHEETVEAVLSDLLFDHRGGFGGGIHLPRSKEVLGRKSRYRPRVFTEKLPAILDTMALPDVGLVRQEIGERAVFRQPGEARRTCVRPGPELLRISDACGAAGSDFHVVEDDETVILKRVRDPADYWDRGGEVEYVDTATTNAFRAELAEINHWLAEADIEFVPPADAPASLLDIDDHDRRLRRIFTRDRFDSGGRLFGGFWQPMRGEWRKRSILIEAEAVVSCDFDQMAPRMLYGRAGAALPAGDLYVLPGLEDHRAGVKKIMNAMLFHSEPLRRFPKGTRKMFPADITVSQVVSAVAAKHDPICRFFGTAVGHELQFAESEIMVDVLIGLRSLGIIALPIHDAVVVQASKAQQVKAVMLEVFREHTEADGGVTME